jgi:hypothetical protein
VSTSPCAVHRMTANWYGTESPIRFRYEPGKRHLWNRHYANFRAQRRQKENQRSLILSFVKVAPAFAADVCDISPAIQAEFRQLASRWRNETAHVSSIPDLIMHPSYQKIIRMPKSEVLPLIFRELRDRGGFWFPALYAITDENPVDHKYIGNVTKMTEVWLAWGRKNGWILGA